MGSGGTFFRVFLALSLLGCFSVDVVAKNGWDTNAGLTVQGILSDNIQLSSNNPESDLGFRISPSIGVRRNAARNKLYFQYRLDYLDYLRTSSRDEFRHFLTADWTSELYRDVLFLDVKANANQNLIFSFLPSGGDDFNTTGNTTQTFTYSISPYIRKRLKGFADLNLRYTFDQVHYDTSLAQDSTGHSARFSLESGRDFPDFPWSVTGDYKKIEYDGREGPFDTGVDEFRSTLARMSYVVNRHWRPNAYIGYDNNDYATTRDDPKGVIYGVGVTWTPNPRTEVDVAYGHRYFGNNLYFDIKYRQRKSVITASLTHEPSSAREEATRQQTFQPNDAFGNFVVDPATGQQIFIEPGAPSLGREVYILSALNFDYDLKVGRRDTVGFNMYYRIRDYEISTRDERTAGFGARWTHNLAANTTSNLNFRWGQSRYEQDELDDQTWRLTLGVTRDLSLKSDVSLILSHINRDAELSSLGYTENRATLSLATRW